LLPEGSDLHGAFASIGRDVGMEVAGPTILGGFGRHRPQAAAVREAIRGGGRAA